MPIVKKFVDAHPAIGNLLSGVLATAALKMFMAFLPNVSCRHVCALFYVCCAFVMSASAQVLHAIITTTSHLKAGSVEQLKLQQWSAAFLLRLGFGDDVGVPAMTSLTISACRKPLTAKAFRGPGDLARARTYHYIHHHHAGVKGERAQRVALLEWRGVTPRATGRSRQRSSACEALSTGTLATVAAFSLLLFFSSSLFFVLAGAPEA